MKRALGVMLLVLLACGSGSDTPTADPAGEGSKRARKEVKSLEERFVWRDESQPAGDLDAAAAACTERVEEDPGISEEAHRLVKIGAFVECMREMGWKLRGARR